MGFREKFNRYYTDPTWVPSKTIYVSPNGAGDGTNAATPASPTAGLSQATPGTKVEFLKGKYDGCFQLDDTQSGTYDAPIVLYAERNGASLGVQINCCNTGRASCFNFEAASYVAVDGFELIGGVYGVRAVGSDYAASMHSKGVAVLHNLGHDQNRDPFFTGEADWFVIEGNTAHDAGAGDGHGIYLSNGSDWLIARNNETYSTHSSDFQINADPLSCCDNQIYNVPDCDDLAGNSEGGKGASDFVLVENNFFHHSNAQGANFTSVRHSVMRNNIFALPTTHGVSFWQETDNPKLGSTDNLVFHNLFTTRTAGGEAVSFIVNSDRNLVKNNIFLSSVANGDLMEVDGTTNANVYEQNVYISGVVNGRTPGGNELVLATFDTGWFTAFPGALANDPNGYKPTASAPFLNRGALLPEVTLDRAGLLRSAPTDPGPFELP